MSPDVGAAVAEAFREEWGRVVATLIRLTGDWDLAEECAQDAFAQALERWPRDGVPRRPGAWLTTVARNRALDRLRRGATEAASCGRRLPWPSRRRARPTSTTSGIADDRLRLIFTCCHPALPLEARVALTLRTLAGLTTAEIARAFLVTEATMAKRLVRAKRKIRDAGSRTGCRPRTCCRSGRPACWPCSTCCSTRATRPPRAPTWCAGDLCAEAIRLARALAELMPDEPEALGLLALMLLHDARRAPGWTTPATWCRWRTRTAPAGTRRDRGGRSALLRRGPAARPARAVPGAGRDRRLPRDAPPTPRTPTGPQIAALYGGWCGWCRPRWWS